MTELNCYVQGWFKSRSTASVEIDGWEVDLPNMAKLGEEMDIGAFDTINISISTRRHARSLCDVQDLLFALLEKISPGQLRELSAEIAVKMPEDDLRCFDYAAFSSNYAERLANRDTMQEFRVIKPGDLSRPHCTAFLSDPLRIIRGIKDGRKLGKFSLTYTGQTGNPWRTIQTTVRDLVRSNGPVPDYQIFRSYFAQLREVHAIGTAMVIDEKQRKQLGHAVDRICKARIRGDLSLLHTKHGAFKKVIRGFMNVQSGVHLNTDVEHRIRELEYRLIALEAALPRIAEDVSFYGYNIVDKLLEAKKNGNRNEKEKAKRKRAVQDDDEKEEEVEENPAKKNRKK